MLGDKPLCKKCIPKFFDNINLAQGSTFDAGYRPASAPVTRDQYVSEKSLISRSLERANNFKRELKILQTDLSEKEALSVTQLQDLTPLMESMFDKLAELLEQAE